MDSRAFPKLLVLAQGSQIFSSRALTYLSHFFLAPPVYFAQFAAALHMLYAQRYGNRVDAANYGQGIPEAASSAYKPVEPRPQRRRVHHAARPFARNSSHCCSAVRSASILP